MNNSIDATIWCREQYITYDDLSKEMMDLQRILDPSPLQRAKIKRLERELDAADVKATLAATVDSIKKTEPSGTMSFNVPSVNLDVKIKW